MKHCFKLSQMRRHCTWGTHNPQASLEAYGLDMVIEPIRATKLTAHAVEGGPVTALSDR